MIKKGISAKHCDNLLCFGIGAAIGALFFMLVYGFSTLNVTYDSWIYNGYIESDIIQRYAGWMFFRNSSWTMPLAVANNITQPAGMAITFTDSVPLAAVLCKLFAPILPQTFQYIGWYNLINCILQGGFAFLLVRHFNPSKLYCALSSVLFVCYPIFAERLFRHDGLASQWLLLAALLCYFKAQRGKWCGAGFALLCTLSAAIHIYFLPMLYALLLAAAISYIKSKKQFCQAGIWCAVCGAGSLFMMYQLGIITRGGDGTALGFGEYSMNLNALVNPRSFDYYSDGQYMKWSNILPVLPQNFKQYEGFNYLGFGVICVLLLMLGWLVYAVIKKDEAKARLLSRLKRHWALAAVCLIMSAFAVSNVVAIGSDTLFKIPLPSFISYIGSVFRASGRFFWPASYLLLLSAVLFAANIAKPRLRNMAMVALIIVQLFDISPALYAKHKYFASGAITAETVYETDEWRFFAENYDNALFVDPIFDYELAAGLIRYNTKMQTNALLANRGVNSVIAATRYDALIKIQDGSPLPDDTMYIGKDSMLPEVLKKLHGNARAYKIGEYIIVANAKEGCVAKEYKPE